MLLPTNVEAALARVELCVDKVSVAIVSGEPSELIVASGALQQAAVDFSYLLQRLTEKKKKNKELKLRVKRIAAGMATQREGLIRRNVLVSRALNVIVPATRSTTYAQAVGPYGSAGKQTGVFKVLAA